jgi:hypothetical protein
MQQGLVLWCPLQIIIDVVMYGRCGALKACFDVAFLMLALPFLCNRQPGKARARGKALTGVVSSGPLLIRLDARSPPLISITGAFLGLVILALLRAAVQALTPSCPATAGA